MLNTVFTNAQILYGSGADPCGNEVLVQGNHIKEIARDGTSVARDDAEVVDGGGRRIPGLVESHDYPSFANTSTLEGLGEIPPPRAAGAVAAARDHAGRQLPQASGCRPRGATPGSLSSQAGPTVGLSLISA